MTIEGDRFYWANSGLILECVNEHDEKAYKCIHLGNGKHGWSKVGEIFPTGDWIDRNHEYARYLGNFSKADSFTTLYEKLSNRD